MKAQKGFGLVEGLLIILILLVVGFGGYYVLSKNDDNISESDSALIVSDDAENDNESEDSAVASRADSWKRVVSGQEGFTVNIPDGWKILNVLDSNWMTIRTADDTVFQEGTLAEVTESESFGTDGSSRILIMRFDDDNFAFLDGDEENLGDFSANNVTGTKYYKQYPEEVGDGIGPLPGQKTYTYKFEVGDSTAFVVYNQQKGESDILDIVEEMIPTLAIK